MKILEYPSDAAKEKVKKISTRGIGYAKKDLDAVNKILDDVRENGDAALIRYVNRFDAPDLTVRALKVTDSEFAAAEKQVDPAFIKALERAAGQIETFHRQQLPKSWIDTRRPGTLLGQMVHPVDRAGVYTPGGKGGNTPLVSSVLMGAIPAKIAGVGEIVMVTPPTEKGAINPHLLVAAKKTGVDAVFKAGSAWAIAALAYGTKVIPAVDVIVGPGNIYVTLAKKIVSGTVGIDMIAGPSEILIIADDRANPEYAAADLLSQAEHDPLASAILVTDSKPLAERVCQAVTTRLETLGRADIARKSIDHFGAVMVVDSIEQAVELANQIAPEHLELQVKDPMDYVGGIKNAGAIFVGDYTPEPVGDYVAGPNHVLPTAGTARFSSALSVENFIKKTSLIKYSKAAFEKEADDIIRLAEIEGLDAHAGSIKVRLER